MELLDLQKEIKYFNNVLLNHKEIFLKIKNETVWNESIHSRKTISYGIPYNYSNITYLSSPFPLYIVEIAKCISTYLNFSPNNCLINYYDNGMAKMGFHSDQIDLLYEKTGIAIISLGNKRIMRFKKINNKNMVLDFSLEPNSLFYMTREVQKEWLHSILPDKQDLDNHRISITFRKIKLSENV